MYVDDVCVCVRARCMHVCCRRNSPHPGTFEVERACGRAREEEVKEEVQEEKASRQKKKIAGSTAGPLGRIKSSRAFSPFFLTCGQEPPLGRTSTQTYPCTHTRTGCARTQVLHVAANHLRLQPS